jgi:glycine/D-amino acid oxidase-like deaminating enzyme
MGLSAAWALAGAGWQVRVLDQDALPNSRGSSNDQHRLIRHAYGAEAGYTAMAEAAFAAWDRLWAELGETLYVPTGVLALAEAAGGWLAESRATLRAAGHAVEDLSPSAVTARFPMLSAERLADAFLMREGGVLLAGRILDALLRRCATLGVAFETAAVAVVDPEYGRCRLASGTEHSADILVVAAGPWVGRLLPGLATQVTPSRQVIVMLKPPAPLHPAWQAAPMLLDLAEDGGFYAVPPVAGTSLKIGDHRFTMTGDADDRREASVGEAEAILALAHRRLPGLAQYRVLSARACYYDVSPGERFILAPLGARGWVMSGFSGHGFKFGPLLGLALARAVANPNLAAGLPAWAAGLAPPPPGLC